MTKTILVTLADGFEEIEAIAPVDLWRRLGFNVITIGVSSLSVKGAHQITLNADTLISEAPSDFDAIVLPGGMPGSLNLKNSKAVIQLVRKHAADGKLVAAICAAPIALHAAGILQGRRVTSHPSVAHELAGAIHTGARVQRDCNIITGKGPGASLEFAAEVADALGKGAEAQKTLQEMFVLLPS